METVYICGAYSADTEEARNRNIKVAILYMEKWLRAGYCVICPHTNFANTTAVAEHQIMRNCLELVRKCTKIIILPTWVGSKGAMMEVVEASTLGIERVYENDELIKIHFGG